MNGPIAIRRREAYYDLVPTICRVSAGLAPN